MNRWGKKIIAPVQSESARLAPTATPDWDGIRARIASLSTSGLPPSVLAALDQNGKFLQDALELFGIKQTDADALYCVAVGVVLMDICALDMEMEDGERPGARIAAEIVMSALMPLIDKAGIIG